MCLHFYNQPIYEDPDLPHVSILNAALSGVGTANEPQYETAANWYAETNTLPQEIAKSIAEEEAIYSTPFDCEQSNGPIYRDPPSDEHKIYEEYEGKRFQKLYRKEIWLAM